MAGAGSPAGRASSRSGERRLAQVRAGPRHVDPEGGRHEARPARQAVIREDPDGPRRCARRGLAAGRMQRRPAVTHQVQAVQRFDGADEDRGRVAGRFGDDVEAVVHPVDKVHVGMTGRPEHRPVAGGWPEASVRCPVVDADVGLNLDDPPGPAARLVVADEARAEQASGGRERGAGEKRAVDDAQARGR